MERETSVFISYVTLTTIITMEGSLWAETGRLLHLLLGY